MLINRVDSKFIFNIDYIENILDSLKNNYFVVDYGNGIYNKYLTTYFDTEDLRFYYMHHNKKNRRLKVRQRTYVNSKLNFFEVKHKVKRRTVKERNLINQEDLLNEITNFREIYLDKEQELTQSLVNKFERVTLVNKNKTERITLDFNIEFINLDNSISLKNLVIMELKQNKINRDSIASQEMRKLNIRKTNFSKYFVGLNFLRDDLKYNNFKPIKRKLFKNDIEVVNG